MVRNQGIAFPGICLRDAAEKEWRVQDFSAWQGKLSLTPMGKRHGDTKRVFIKRAQVVKYSNGLSIPVGLSVIDLGSTGMRGRVYSGGERALFTLLPNFTQEFGDNGPIVEERELTEKTRYLYDTYGDYKAGHHKSLLEGSHRNSNGEVTHVSVHRTHPVAVLIKKQFSNANKVVSNVKSDAFSLPDRDGKVDHLVMPVDEYNQWNSILESSMGDLEWTDLSELAFKLVRLDGRDWSDLELPGVEIRDGQVSESSLTFAKQQISSAAHVYVEIQFEYYIAPDGDMIKPSAA
jgi:hypothetical protein